MNSKRNFSKDSGMDQNTYKLEWLIKGKTLKRFKNAKFKEREDGPHMFIGSVLFYISINPKGSVKENATQILFYCNARFHDISQLKIEFTMELFPINYKKGFSRTFSKFPYAFGNNDDINFNSIKRLNKLCITVNFKILSIVNKENVVLTYNSWNEYLYIDSILSNIKRFKWELNDNELTEIQELKYQEQISSDTMYIDNIPFQIRLYPKGNRTQNNVSIFICCQAYKLDIIKLDAFYRIYIDEIQLNHVNMHSFTKNADNLGLPAYTLKSKDILNMDSLIIKVDIKIYNIIFKNGSTLPTDMDKTILNIDDIKSDSNASIFNLFGQKKEDGYKRKMEHELDLVKLRNISTKQSVIDLRNEIQTNYFDSNTMNQKIDSVITNYEHECNTLRKDNKKKTKAFNDLKQKQILLEQKHNILLKEINKLNRYVSVIKMTQNIKINDDISNLLYPLNLMQFYSTFIDNGFETNDELKDLNSKDLKDMGIHKIAQQKKILNAVKLLNNENLNNNNDIKSD